MYSKLAFLALLVTEAAGHGWVTQPVSKNHMAARHYVAGMPSRLRYEPQSSAGAGSCGTSAGDGYTQGLDRWEPYYETAGVPVPELVPGTDFELKFTLTADHGGQTWMMVACGSTISEATNWTYLERASSDRDRGYLPSHPAIYAWSQIPSKKGVNRYTVPSWFSCPDYKAVGRWLWKVGNSCNDFNNVGKKTEAFSKAEYLAAGGTKLATCGAAPETFISCFDFKVTGPASPTPAPAPTQAPAPTPAPPPAPPTAAPTPAPAPSCCKWSSSCSGSCASGWCSSSQANCGGCGGTWCAPTLLSTVKQHV